MILIVSWRETCARSNAITSDCRPDWPRSKWWWSRRLTTSARFRFPCRPYPLRRKEVDAWNNPICIEAMIVKNSGSWRQEEMYYSLSNPCTDKVSDNHTLSPIHRQTPLGGVVGPSARWSVRQKWKMMPHLSWLCNRFKGNIDDAMILSQNKLLISFISQRRMLGLLGLVKKTLHFSSVTL